MTGADFVRLMLDSLCDACMARAEEIYASIGEPHHPGDVIQAVVRATESRDCERCKARLEALSYDAITGKFGGDEDEDGEGDGEEEDR